MSLLKIDRLSLGYGSDVILKDLSFSLDDGDYLYIVGENGSGKSTLMKTMLGLIPSLGGSIIMGGGLDVNEIGYLPQQTAIQRDFPASVFEIVLSGFQAKCKRSFYYNQKEKRLAFENMERLNISHMSKRCYRDLSGGQQQRVLLARALCAADKLLLLDEPVSGLDPIVTEEMYTLIQSLNRDGVTIIMVSHDINAALKYASHILHIGATVFFGTKDEYLSNDIAKVLSREAAHYE